MEVKEAINERRAYRALEPIQITQEIINSLAESARIAPSCFNNQPWRYIFVYDPEVLKNMHSALSKGNEWAQLASMMIVVFSKKEKQMLEIFASVVASGLRKVVLQEKLGFLEEKLEERKLIEKAKGVLMKKENLNEGEAYQKMQKEAMKKRKKIKEIAEAIILLWG